MTAPKNCSHPSTNQEAIGDGKGGIAGYHYRCTVCHMIIRTEMT